MGNCAANAVFYEEKEISGKERSFSWTFFSEWQIALLIKEWLGGLGFKERIFCGTIN